MAEKTIKLKRGTRLAKEGSFLAGAGRDDRLPVGIMAADSRRQRAYLQLQDDSFPATWWDEMFELEAIELWAYKVSYYRVDEGASPRARVRRTTARDPEGTSDTLSSTNGGGAVWPGPATHAGSEVRGPVLPTATGRWVKVATITPLGRTWAPTRLGGSGTAMTGLVIAQDNDDWTSTPSFTATLNNVEFASDDWGDGSKAPYLLFRFSDNQPPSAPVPTSPDLGGSSAVVVGTSSGTELTVEFLYSDPDGDPIKRVEMEVYGDGETSTDPAISTRLATTGAVTPTPLGPLNAYRVKLTGLPSRTTMRARLHVQDARNAWSDWTLLTEGRFTTAYVPGAPLQSLMQTDPDRPDIFGTLNTPDASDHVTGWEGEFYRDTPQGRITLWAPGMQDIGGSSTRSQVEYAGAVLNDGDVVRWRHRHRNRDGVVGAWSEELSTTIESQVGPTISPGDTGTKVLTRTPALTLTFDGSSDGYQYRLYRAGVLVHDSGVVGISAAGSTVVTVPAGYLNWGDTIEVDAAGRPAGTGTLGPFSPPVSLYIDTLPTTSIAASDGDVTGSIVPTLDVLWESPYTDPDAARYGEVPVAKELELRVAATPQGSGTLIERRQATTATGWVVEDERTGRRLDALTSATGSAADTAVTVTTSATAPTGYSGNSLEIQATGGSSSNRWGWLPVVADISGSGGGALLKVWRRVTSVTNLTRWIVRLEFASDVTSNLEYELANATTPLNTWEEIVIPLQGRRAVGATAVDLADLTGIRVWVNPSAAYTGNLQLRDLRVGTVQTAKTTPDGHIAAEASVDARARYRDDATHKASTTLGANTAAGATTIRLTAITGFAVGDELTIESAAGNIETRTITTLGTAGATDTVVSPAFTFAHTSGDTIKAYFWGPWTGWLTVKASVPPTVAVVSPADRSVVTDPTPALVHSFTSPGSKAQALRTTRLYRRRGYAQRALATGPASYWRMGEASSYLVDEVAARRNLFANPGAEVDVTGITAATAVTRSADFAYAGTYSAKVTTAGSADHNVGSQSVTVALGDVYTFSVYVYVPVGSALAGRTASLNDEGANASTGRTEAWSVTRALVAGAWNRVGVGYRLDGTATAARTLVVRYSGADDTGSAVYTDGWLAEPGSVTMRPYFNGASGTGFTWDGTAHASASRSTWGVRGSVGGAADVTRAVTGLLAPADSDGAIALGGSSGYVTFGDAYGFVGLQPFSVGGWVIADSHPSGTERLIDKFSEANYHGWGVRYLSTGAFAFTRGQNGVGVDTLTTGTFDAAGTLYHVMATFDGATMAIYVDGELAASAASTKAMTHGTGELLIGRRSDSAAQFLDATTDEWGLWDRALTPEEVAAIVGGRAESPGDELLYELDTTGTGTSDTLPALLLEDVTAYAWEKTAYDSDGLEGTTDRVGFSTLFTAPDEIVGAAPSGGWSLTQAAASTVGATALPFRHPFREYIRARAVSYWRVNEAAGATTAIDLMGVKNGTALGITTGAFGAAGLLANDADAKSFDSPGGSADRIDTTNTAAHDFLGGTTPWTIGFIADIDAMAANRLPWNFTGGTGNVVVTFTSAATYHQIQRSDGTTTNYCRWTDAVIGKHLWVFTYDGAMMRAYRDGVLATPYSGLNPVASTIPISVTSKIVRFIGGGSTTGIDGRMSDVFIDDACWTAAEVAELHGLYLSADWGIAENDALRVETDDSSEVRRVLSVGTAGAAGTGIGVAPLRYAHAAASVIAERGGIAATADADASTVELEWDASTDPDLDHYRVHWRDAHGEYVRVDGGPEALDDGRTPLTDASFVHHGARLGENEYLVTVHTGALGSDPTATEATLAGPTAGGAWMLVSEDDDRYTVPLRVLSAPRVRDATIERFAPPGRGSTVHLVWGLAGRRVSVRVQLRPTVDGDIATLLEELLVGGTSVWLKAPAGWLWDPMWVVVAGVTDDPGVGGMLAISLELEETERV
jgi:hypothetical protein